MTNNADTGSGMGQWKEQAFKQQMSSERDFPNNTAVKFKFVLCCGHRTGSNLLGEALYKSGQAGDPMEYYNLRFLTRFVGDPRQTKINFAGFLAEMQSRRTSPNGVFGINVKFDQLRMCFKDNWKEAIQLIKNNDHVLYLYRKDRLGQAISAYIGQCRDVFNVPAGVSDKDVWDLVASVPFNPVEIAKNLNRGLLIEHSWLEFFKDNGIAYESLAYEDLVKDYDSHMDRLLGKFGVPEEERHIPEKPMKKIANKKNLELRKLFIEHIGGDDFSDMQGAT